MTDKFVLNASCAVSVSIHDCFSCLFTGEYVSSGSDDGRWLIWEKRTGRLVKMLNGDEAGNVVFPSERFGLLVFSSSMVLMKLFLSSTVVNCVQCHPHDFVVATSGIDSTIKVRMMVL